MKTKKNTLEEKKIVAQYTAKLELQRKILLEIKEIASRVFVFGALISINDIKKKTMNKSYKR